jgi:hypothetical protein
MNPMGTEMLTGWNKGRCGCIIEKYEDPTGDESRHQYYSRMFQNERLLGLGENGQSSVV